MEITLVKNPARRNAKRRKRRANPKGRKNDGSRRKCRICKRVGHNQRTCSKLGRKRKSSVRDKGVGRGKGKRHCGKCGRMGHNRKTCKNKKKAATKRKTATKRRKSSKRKKSATRRRNSRRRNPKMATMDKVMKKPVESIPIIGDMGFAKKADKEIAIDAHGAQGWKKASMTGKTVMAAGGLTGYGYGAGFTQYGQDLADNVIMSSAAGMVTGVGGLAASSWAINLVGGDMLFKKHEKKSHTFANFTKGWKYGGYIAVGLNTVTNLLTAVYGRSYSGLTGWNGILAQSKYDLAGAIKKAAVMSSGAHKLAHVPAVAGFMYETSPDGPLQGFKFGQNLAGESDGMPGSGHGDRYMEETDGYYHDPSGSLGYVSQMGDRPSSPVGYVDNLGYPSGVGYPAEFSDNQPLYG